MICLRSRSHVFPAWAALLAGIGAGVYKSFEEAGNVTSAAEADAVQPDPGVAAVYDPLFDLYEELYPRTKEIMHGLGGQDRSA